MFISGGLNSWHASITLFGLVSANKDQSLCYLKLDITRYALRLDSDLIWVVVHVSKLDSFSLKLFIIFAEKGYKLLELTLNKVFQLNGCLKVILLTWFLLIYNCKNDSPLSFNTYESIVK